MITNFGGLDVVCRKEEKREDMEDRLTIMKSRKKNEGKRVTRRKWCEASEERR
jgi:hypothetical protein